MAHRAPPRAHRVLDALCPATASSAARPQRSRFAMTLQTKSYLDTRRAGPRPRTTATNPHTQLDQNAPPDLQERVFEIGRSLSGVAGGPSPGSGSRARAVHFPGCGPWAPGAL